MARVKYYDHQSEQWKYADTAFGVKGDPGKTPEKGVDYFTEEDKQEMIGRLIDEGVLTYNEQELTEEQKAQARENIGIDQISFDKLTENLDADGFRITNLPFPQSGSEPATKDFVENFTIEGSTYVATDDGEGNVTIRPYLADEDELVFKSHIQNQNNPHNVTAAQVGARPNSWMPTAEEVKARPDTWIPTAEEVGAVTQQDMDTAKATAIAEAKTYTNTQVKKSAPRNLLDNSYFANPVNQRGGTDYSGAVYGIDRWKGASTDCVVGVRDGHVKFSSSGSGVATQQINTDENNLYGKTVTIACEDYSGNIYCASGTIPESKPATSQVSCYVQIDAAQVELYISKSTGPNVRIYTPNCELRLKWVALYEGEYTAETLPVYQPKGYGAELLECQRYFYRFATDANGIYLPCIAGITQIPGFLFPVSMRTAPSMTIEVLKTWTTAGFTDISGSISSKRCTKGGLPYIELTSAQSKSGLVTLTANFSADIPQTQ